MERLSTAMYIKKVTLTNVRCFKHVEFDLSSGSGVQRWGVILGDNGVGKTTILRSIAMGLCDETGAASLLQDTYGDWVRWGEKEATIKIDLLDGDKECSIVTTISYESNSNLETIKQNTFSEGKFPWDEIFVCGYGANRSIKGDTSYDSYSLADALFTLFDYRYGGALQNPELILWRQTHTQKREDICHSLDDILMLEKGSTKLDEGGIKIKGSWGRHVYFGSLPDGYAATVTFVLDMIGWATLKSLKKKNDNPSGIILIDEIEQHLHPSWQKYFIKLLHQVFPHKQFIATTHSPLCAIGTANLPKADEVCSLLALRQEGDSVVGQDKIKPPRGKRADQVLTSELFGLATATDDPTKEAIYRYVDLQSSSRSEEEEKEYQKLNEYLGQIIGSAERPLEQEIADAVKKVLTEQRDDSLSKSSGQQRLVDLEIARQLHNILKGDQK